MKNQTLNLFYEEPKTDRWIRYDHYPRQVIRRLIRGKQRPGGVATVALNLMAGLKKLNIPFRFNDYAHIKKHPEELACLVGKPHLLFEWKWQNPILFGAGIFSHPLDCPELFERYPNVKQILVPGEWMRRMFEPYYGNKVIAWPTGIDTEIWSPYSDLKEYDFLIYDKILWKQNRGDNSILNHVTKTLEANNLRFNIIQYGNYMPDDLADKLKNSSSVIFLCEHETQGIAYQQMLSSDLPILAWDQAGFWQDPSYYPHKVKYEPVSSVPYWDNRCGLKFKGIKDFDQTLKSFLALRYSHQFNPRNYILENLSIEKCALDYFRLTMQIADTNS